MKKTESKGRKYTVVWMLLGALAFALCSAVALAADADLDGFDDALEGGTVSSVDDPTGQNPQFNFILERSKKDLFVILRKASNPPSLIPDRDPLLYVAHPNLAVHMLPRDLTNANREVLEQSKSKQKAVRLTENNTSTLSNGMILGVCTYGTPNYYDDAIIYTQRIKEWVDQKSAGANEVCLATACNSASDQNWQNWLQTIKETYIRHTIAHETGHMMRLTRKYNSSYGGYHYAAGTGVLMDQSVYYTNKSGKVTWYIPTQYSTGDTPLLK